MATSNAPFIIKICGIMCEEDAREATAAGANALGFNFYPKSPRYITLERARQIVQAVPDRYLKVGVFVNSSEGELLSAAAAVPLDVLQLHGERCVIPSASPYRIWRSIPGGSAAPPPDDRIEAYLLDAPTSAYGGSGRPFNWSLAAGFPYGVIVAGGLEANNVAAAIAAVRPWGVDACSRLERFPGRKDPDRVRAFVAAATLASRNIQPEELKV